jgi:heme/copper-type cytochrome/quinol oxidase subunit 4
MSASNTPNGGTGRDVAVYVCLLILAAIQFVISYQNISAGSMFARMFIVAIIEGALALLFFMHLWENRGLRWFVLIFSIATTLGMQYGWTDSYRQLLGVPWAH